MFNSIKSFFKSFAKLFSGDPVGEYRRAAIRFGQAVALIPVGGECEGFDRIFKNWRRTERGYYDAGYLPLPVEFLKLVYDLNPKQLKKWSSTFIGIQPLSDEDPRNYCHAPIYASKYWHKIGELEEKTGHVVFPTTAEMIEIWTLDLPEGENYEDEIRVRK